MLIQIATDIMIEITLENSVVSSLKPSNKSQVKILAYLIGELSWSSTLDNIMQSSEVTL